MRKSDLGKFSFCIFMYFGMNNRQFFFFFFLISGRYVIRTFVKLGINTTSFIYLNLHILHVLNTHTHTPIFEFSFLSWQRIPSNAIPGSELCWRQPSVIQLAYQPVRSTTLPETLLLQASSVKTHSSIKQNKISSDIKNRIIHIEWIYACYTIHRIDCD